MRHPIEHWRIVLRALWHGQSLLVYGENQTVRAANGEVVMTMTTADQLLKPRGKD